MSKNHILRYSESVLSRTGEYEVESVFASSSSLDSKIPPNLGSLNISSSDRALIIFNKI